MPLCRAALRKNPDVELALTVLQKETADLKDLLSQQNVALSLSEKNNEEKTIAQRAVVSALDFRMRHVSYFTDQNSSLKKLSQKLMHEIFRPFLEPMAEGSMVSPQQFLSVCLKLL